MQKKKYFQNIGLVCFLCLMVYQPSWIIQFWNHPCRRTVVVLFNPELWEDKGVHTFPKGISPKVNVITWLEFKLADYNVQHYATRTPS